MIALLGATGRVGSIVAERLAELDAPACTITRRPMAVSPLPIRHADLADEVGLTRALGGVERLLLLTPNSPRQAEFEDNAVRAALRAGVGHVVKISGGAATLGPNGTTATATAHWRSEQAIEASGIGFTFLRPAPYAQPFLERLAPVAAATGLLPNPIGAAAVAFLDVRDLADAAVAALRAPDPADQAWSITGPRALTLAAIGERLGLRTLRVPAAAATRTLRRAGASAFELDHAARMTAFLAAGGGAGVSNHLEGLTGAPARPLDALLSDVAHLFTPTGRAGRARSPLTHKEAR